MTTLDTANNQFNVMQLCPSWSLTSCWHVFSLARSGILLLYQTKSTLSRSSPSATYLSRLVPQRIILRSIGVTDCLSGYPREPTGIRLWRRVLAMLIRSQSEFLTHQRSNYWHRRLLGYISSPMLTPWTPEMPRTMSVHCPFEAVTTFAHSFEPVHRKPSTFIKIKM